MFCAMAFCLAFLASAQSDYLGAGSSGSTMGSSGDFLSPNFGPATTHSTLDEGLAGMLQWLDQPVPNFPWYSSDGSFYSQGIPDSTFSPYREYYTTAGKPVVGGIISNPAKYNVAQNTPAGVYYGDGQGLPYSQYVSTTPSMTNDLWIQGGANWSQYVVVPVGTWLELVANVPVGGTAGFYETVQTNKINQKYRTYQFYPGYNTMDFNADQVGRHMLYFVVNNQPSNVVIVDAFTQVPPGTSKPVHTIS